MALEVGDGGAGFLAPGDGFVSLARFPPDREQAARPFRMAKAAKSHVRGADGAVDRARDIDPARQKLVAALHTSEVAPKSPSDIEFVATAHRPIPLHAATVHFELTALLYAIGQEPESALDAAVRALSCVRRHAREHANHQANLRIARAMRGEAVENEVRITADYHTTAAHKLAERVLGKLPPTGIELVVRHRYR